MVGMSEVGGDSGMVGECGVGGENEMVGVSEVGGENKIVGVSEVGGESRISLIQLYVNDSIFVFITGYDLIEWLMENLDIQDSIEALHLANLFCQYGYIFPVQDIKNLVVKDDSTLYRFQSPYFWPSQNWDPDNADYAIYLAKRSMRNKQRHGLDDYETNAFTKLQRMLCHKWEFVYMQAEEQIRIAKQRKKSDKIVLDSQERAFWRVHRPPPGQINSLESSIKRNCRMTTYNVKKRRTLEDYKKQIAYLQRALQRPRLKTSKAIHYLIQHCEQYAEHDPIISGAQPSNPWVTDDTTMWVLNTVLVDIPTERRVKRWAISLKELLSDATGRHEFEMFLRKEYSQENIRFWQACEELKFSPQSQIEQNVQEIYKEFLATGARCEINVDGKTVEVTQKALQKPCRFTFEAAQTHIFMLMKKDSYPRFLRSDAYKNLLAHSLQPSSKKKFFTFGNRLKTAKVTPNASPQPLRRRGSANDMTHKAHNARHGLSLSTGNLQDLDKSDEKINADFLYSDVYQGGESKENSPNQSPTSNKKFIIGSPITSRKKVNFTTQEHVNMSLEVPKRYPVNSPDSPEVDTNSKPLSFPVPSKKSLITPWEEQDIPTDSSLN
ncbi:regulator of G-protein signaling 9-like [Saccoglossus kowalevskii]|uniref:Regulator of G-protein signaling 9-like n=1 Tax=Saccoglossus kowalevskii TaxID=10224 RepID=A0ABM0M0A2_SACKO|nr:PREDICTED: regulator of G-protein signaling 9-like [Saccoglossus kowalevskii]